MSSMKIALLAAVAFAAPLAVTIAYQLRPEQANSETDSQRRIGKVLYFSSPG